MARTKEDLGRSGNETKRLPSHSIYHHFSNPTTMYGMIDIEHYVVAQELRQRQVEREDILPSFASNDDFRTFSRIPTSSPSL